MHYKNNNELPDELRKTLPPEAQTLYRTTYNDAFPELREQIRRDSEEKAHEAAWKAVQAQYRQEQGKWIKRTGKS